MDLSILVRDTIVNIRVAGLVKTLNGFLFEKSKNGYIFTLGGRVKLGETSREAMIREVMEEIGMNVQRLTLQAIIENFYVTKTEKVQEICYVYGIDEIFTGIIPPEFIEVSVENINKYDVKPNQLVDILKNRDGSFKHIIIK